MSSRQSIGRKILALFNGQEERYFKLGFLFFLNIWKDMGTYQRREKIKQENNFIYSS